MNQVKHIFIFSVIALLSICVCTRDYNPFTDPANARASVFSVSFKNFDTVNIFATETLSLKVEVRELVDSITCVAKQNRRAHDIVSLKPDSNETMLPAKPYSFLFSFCDTGTMEIEITTYRHGIEKIVTEYSLFCKSPLLPRPVVGCYGKSITLSTAKVSDNDVMYHWDLGNNTIIVSPNPDTTFKVLYTQPLSDSGQLWVSDLDGNHKSPVYRFFPTLQDTFHPIIKCGNRVRNDSIIITADSVFYLQISISDSALLAPNFTAFVNNAPFSISQGSQFVKIIDNMETYKTPHPYLVKAVANTGSRDTSYKTYYLSFDPSVGKGSGINFYISSPPSRSTTTSSVKDKTILGYFENFTPDTAKAMVKLWMNGTRSNTVDTVVVAPNSGIGSPVHWSMPCSLTSDTNKITVLSQFLKTDTIGFDSLTIIYNKNQVDTIGPAMQIFMNDKIIDKSQSVIYTPLDNASIRIIAYDEASSVDSVTVNRVKLPVSTDAPGLIWYDIAQLNGVSRTDSIEISAFDKNHNKTTQLIIVKINHPPQFFSYPNIPAYVITNQLGVYTYQGIDPDPDDKISLILPSLSGFSNIAGKNSFTWVPQEKDTGVQTLIFTLTDGYEYVPYTVKCLVMKATTLPPPTRFAFSVDSIPKVLEVGKDTLNLLLVQPKDTASDPITFLVNTTSGDRQLTKPLVNKTERRLQWVPTMSDTGVVDIWITMADKYGRGDTVESTILVVPPNRPCKIQVTYAIPFTDKNELDLSRTTKPETLFVSVNDPDPVYAEQLTATIRWPQSQSVIGIDDTRKFMVILNPKSATAKLKDTVRIIVTDKALHSDSATFFISYVSTAGKTLTLNTSVGGIQIYENVVKFPLLVRLDKTNFSFDSSTKTGSDIRFTKLDGTALPFEIEFWDSAAGAAAVWVLADTIYANSNVNYLRISWGNKSGINGQNGTAVFDTALGYQGVWHCSDAAKNSNANSAQSKYAGTGGSGLVDFIQSKGVIAYADSFTKNNYISLGNPPLTTTMSMSAWVYPISYGQWSKILVKGMQSYISPFVVFSLETIGNYPAKTQIKISFRDGDTVTAVSPAALPINTWTYLASTYNGDTASLYVNGTKVSAVSHPGIFQTSTTPFTMGDWSLRPQESFNGSIDEARICNKALSPSYFKLCYENQKPGSTLITFSSP